MGMRLHGHATLVALPITAQSCMQTQTCAVSLVILPTVTKREIANGLVIKVGGLLVRLATIAWSDAFCKSMGIYGITKSSDAIKMHLVS